MSGAIAGLFPEDPPPFLAGLPHGYFSAKAIARHLAGGGFAGSPAIGTVAAISRAETPGLPVLAYCQGTPLRGEVEAHHGVGLEEATPAPAPAARFGDGPVAGRIQALVVPVAR